MSIISDFSPKKESNFPKPVTEPFSPVTAPFPQNSSTPSFLDTFFQNEEIPFGDLLNDELVRQILEKHNCRFGKTHHAVYTPLLVMWMFLWQLLSDESCDAAVAVAIAYCTELAIKPPGIDTGGYVRARNKVPCGVFSDLARHVARELDAKAPPHWKPFGRPAWVVDGTTFTLPATPENLDKFQCHPNQHPDVGMPLPRAIVLSSMATGCILDFAYDNYSGKGTGEISMLRSRLDVFRPGDLVVMDALYCSFTIAGRTAPFPDGFVETTRRRCRRAHERKPTRRSPFLGTTRTRRFHHDLEASRQGSNSRRLLRRRFSGDHESPCCALSRQKLRRPMGNV